MGSTPVGLESEAATRSRRQMMGAFTPLLTAYALATRCRGPLVVLDAQGMPVEGARVDASGVFATTDATGSVQWADRSCGAQTVAVRLGNVQYAGQRVEITDRSPATVQLPPLATATAAFVDEEGEPLSAVIERTAWINTRNRVSANGWLIEAPGTNVPLQVDAPNRPPARFYLPLDGKQHRLVVPMARTVVVEATCDERGCPDLQCSGSSCTEVVAGTFSCLCPGQVAQLLALEQRLEVPEGAVHVRADLRSGNSHVRAIWAGSMPCEATIRWGHSMRADLCGSDRLIEASTPRGTFLLTVRGSQGDETRVLIEAEGTDVDLGEIWPGGEAERPDRVAEVLTEPATLGTSLIGDTGATVDRWDTGDRTRDSGRDDSGGDDSGGDDSGGDDSGGDDSACIDAVLHL